MCAYELEKEIWTEKDFCRMCWHDLRVWSMLAETDTYEYLVDIDYIFKWVEPKENQTHFSFFVAPVTMVFENVYDVRVNLESPQGFIEIAELHMENPELTPNGKFTTHTYRFECQEGEISLKATGYKMYVRQQPKLIESQSFNYIERGGIDFARVLNAL